MADAPQEGRYVPGWTTVFINDTWWLPVADDPAAMSRFGGAIKFNRSEFESSRLADTWMDGDVVWPSSTIMARWLAIKPHPVPVVGKVIIELGAGCGLPSIVSLCLGAKEVLVQDKGDVPLQRVLTTAVRHGLAPKVTTVRCLFRDLLSSIFNGTQAALRRFADADIVLASDVLYDEAVALDVADVLGGLLRRDEQVAYIVDPYKRKHRGNFTNRCAQHGLRVKECELVTWEPEGDRLDEHDPVFCNKLLRITRT